MFFSTRQDSEATTNLPAEHSVTALSQQAAAQDDSNNVIPGTFPFQVEGNNNNTGQELEPIATTSQQDPVKPRPRRKSRRIVVRRPEKIYEEEETIDMACQMGQCDHMWRQNSDCSDVFADHEDHQGDRTVTRPSRRRSHVRSSERIAESVAEQQDRVTDFVQRVLNNESSEESDDMPSVPIVCNKPNCNCVAHSDNSLFDSEQSNDNTFEATPSMLSAASKSPGTSDSGKSLCLQYVYFFSSCF